MGIELERIEGREIEKGKKLRGGDIRQTRR